MYSLTNALQLGHLGGPHVGREPDSVDVDVAGRRFGTEAVTLLEVRRRLGALGVGVGLRTRTDPAVPTHGNRVPLLHLVGQGEELPAGGAHPCAEVNVDAVARDHDEPGALQALVHLDGHRVGVGAARVPARNIDCRNRTHSANPDVLVPQRRVLGDELLHHGHAALVVQKRNPHAVLGQPVVPTGEGATLTDHHRADVELAHQAAAVPARR